MKVTNWRRKLAASLVATGLISPAAAMAAELNTNLVVDPSFENVDPNTPRKFTSLRLIDWMDTGLDGNTADDDAAYPYTENYAGVNTPAGAGARYFTGGFDTTVGQATVTQTVAVSTGATGTLIPTGEAAFNASAFFSSYLTQADSSRMSFRFLNAAAAELGRAEIGGRTFVQSQPTMPGPLGNHRNWAQDSESGLIPVGTTSVAIDIISDVATVNHDGYVDLVDFRIFSGSDVLMFLNVNTITGQVAIRNQTGDSIPIDYYEITSAGGALKTNTWTSLQDQSLPGFPAGNGTGNGWEEAGGVGATILSESFLTGSSSVASGGNVSLGQAFNTPGAAQDLVFQYAVVPPVSLSADFDDDGDADGNDFLRWQRGVGTISGATKAQGDADADGDVDAGDLASWKTQFGSSAFSGAGVLQSGFVRYVTAATPVPEPSTLVLVGAGFAVVVLGRSRNGTID